MLGALPLIIVAAAAGQLEPATAPSAYDREAGSTLRLTGSVDANEPSRAMQPLSVAPPASSPRPSLPAATQPPPAEFTKPAQAAPTIDAQVGPARFSEVATAPAETRGSAGLPLPGPPVAEAPLKLKPPGESAEGSWSDDWFGSSFVTVSVALGVVLALVFAGAWLLRQNLPPGPAALPAEAVAPLGQAAFTGRQSLYLLRFGPKLVLVAASPDSATTLSEVSDPAEVDRLAALCEQETDASITATFRDVLNRMESEPTQGGFFGNAFDDEED